VDTHEVFSHHENRISIQPSLSPAWRVLLHFLRVRFNLFIMFRFAPTVLLGRFRWAVLAAKEFEPIALDPMVAKQLAYAQRIEPALRLQITKRRESHGVLRIT
jgi:hypothetical protein